LAVDRRGGLGALGFGGFGLGGFDLGVLNFDFGGCDPF